MMKWNYTIYPRAHMESLRILVVGDVIHDVYEYYLTENRKELKSEFPGKWAYFNAHEIDALGGAANVAANIASIGIATRLVGVVGADDAGARIEALCEMNGIEQELVKTADRKTTLKMRLYIDGDFLLRRDYESASPIPNDLAEAVEEAALRDFESVSAIVLSDYDKGLFSEQSSLSASIIGRAARLGIPVVVDCKPKNFSQFKGATVIAPNEFEAMQLVPKFGSDRRRGVQKLRELVGGEYCIITLGEEGLICASSDTIISVPGECVTVKNAVGAGDTVRAFIAIGLSMGLSLPETLTMANKAAALVIQKEATATVSRSEFNELLNGLNFLARTA
jgi:D-beta-D-heptose 7-phosphate kinase/D-beta-D-heptose 1-phosphate adenosyltransferase